MRFITKFVAGLASLIREQGPVSAMTNNARGLERPRPLRGNELWPTTYAAGIDHPHQPARRVHDAAEIGRAEDARISPRLLGQPLRKLGPERIVSRDAVLLQRLRD
jgi:hypothetical protein